MTYEMEHREVAERSLWSMFGRQPRAPGPKQLCRPQFGPGLDWVGTERWRRREMSNFEYLMRLNVAAGRTYNDLSQYPVFPWILADYTSEYLDLTKPESFRDLTKPVGALNPARLERFVERHSYMDEEWEMFKSRRGMAAGAGAGTITGEDVEAAEMEGVQIPFMYGSHYSNAGTVLFFLVRLAPFTEALLKLQGGKFDHGERSFHSMAESCRG